MTVQAPIIRKIGILRALQLGDMLCIIPAMRALRYAYPEAEIILLGLPWAASFVERFDKYFDRFIHFPGYEGLPEQEFDNELYKQFENRVRLESFDLLIQMQGNGTIVNDLVVGWGVKQNAGFTTMNIPELPGTFLTYPEGIHEIYRHIKLMQVLDIESAGDHLEFPINSSEALALKKINMPFNPGKYVVIHPGSRGSHRRWPPALFAETAKLCHSFGYDVVLTGVNGEEEIVDDVINHLAIPYFNACGRTSLGAAAQLIKEAAFIVCNCTGVSHIAAAMETPGIVISMDGEPERWGPLNTSLHKTINWLQVPEPDYVFSQLKELMASTENKLVS